MQKNIDRFTSLGYKLIETRNKAPLKANWNDLALEPQNKQLKDTDVKEAGFVIPKNVCVIDIDPRNFKDNVDSLDLLSKEINFDLKYYAPYTVHTASGGMHLYYKKDENINLPNEIKGFPGVELKSKNRQVIIASSILPDGRKYTEDKYQNNLENLINLPENIYKFKSINTQKVKKVNKNSNSSFTNSKYNKWRLKKQLEKTKPAISGENGDNYTFKVCCLGKDYGLDEDTFFDVLGDWNDRCQPPWSCEELKTKINNAYAYSTDSIGSRNYDNLFEHKKKIKINENWEETLQKSKNGGYCKNLLNTVNIIRNDINMKDCLGYNDFTSEIYWVKPPSWRENTNKLNADYDCVKIKYILNADYDFDIPKPLIHDAIVEIASTNRFHPIKNWLNDLPEWDGTPRIENLLTDNFEIEKNKYTEEIMQIFFCALLSRIYHPGSKVDMMFILAGDTRAGKSTFFKSLAIENEYFIDTQIPDLDSHKYIPLFKNKLIFEWQELNMFNKYDINKIKAFISTCSEVDREAYRRDATEHKRQFIICATTNQDQFLLDETGNERFYIMNVKKKLTYKDYISIKKVEYIKSIYENKKQIYAEALFLYENKFSLKLSKESNLILDNVRENAFKKDELEETILFWLENIPKEIQNISKHKIQANDIIIHCLKEIPAKNKGLANRIGTILKRNGYYRKSCRDGKTVKSFFCI